MRAPRRKATTGEVGVAPRVIHDDEARRAVVSEHVVNRGFAPRLANPQTRAAAIRQLVERLDPGLLPAPLAAAAAVKQPGSTEKLSADAALAVDRRRSRRSRRGHRGRRAGAAPCRLGVGGPR